VQHHGVHRLLPTGCQGQGQELLATGLQGGLPLAQQQQQQVVVVVVVPLQGNLVRQTSSLTPASQAAALERHHQAAADTRRSKQLLKHPRSNWRGSLRRSNGPLTGVGLSRAVAAAVRVVGQALRHPRHLVTAVVRGR
jgi:hypothetical protein